MMRRVIVIAVCLAAALGVVAAARQSAPQTPTFRAGVELIELDVSVIDKDRHPVLGLTLADFTVTVDGQPRPIVAFKAVDLTPPELLPAAKWVRETAPDVATNGAPAGRVVVIMIDDGSFNQVDSSRTAARSKPVMDLKGIEKMRDVARATVNELGADDLAAVVFTENNNTAQSFTNDRKRLLAAVESAWVFPGITMGFAPPRGSGDVDLRRAIDPQGNWRGNCVCGLCSIDGLRHVAEQLRSLPHQRKVIVYISAGVVVPMSLEDTTAARGGADGACYPRRHLAMANAFKQAALANVSVHAVDPKGLDTAIGGEASDRLQYLKTVAEQTGGRWVVNNNDMERAIPAVLAESASYYLLGVEQPVVNDDGRFHPIRVRVNRPGVEVRTRTGFYAPSERDRRVAAAAGESQDLNAAIGAALPKADIPMDVGVVPILGADRKPAVALVLAVKPPALSSAVARTETVELTVGAFNPENGNQVASRRQRVSVVWNANEANASGEYEVLAKMPLPAGRYELRIGMKSSDGRTASVYASAEVPRFGNEPLSLSGLVLSATPRPKVGGEAELGGLVPIVPTARRTFSPTDQVTGFLRAYEKTQTFSAVTVTTRIVDTMDKTLSTSTQTLTSADYQFAVPLAGLAPGEYLLEVAASLGAATAQRSLRFKID